MKNSQLPAKIPGISRRELFRATGLGLFGLAGSSLGWASPAGADVSAPPCVPRAPLNRFPRMEDGVVLADAGLREQQAAQFADCHARCQVRRAFMADTLSIRLPADVLPLSNIPAVMTPYFLRPNFVFAQ